ncbi:MAG: low molecular weight protein arginine phosphatase [Candidatus Zixiibacteriota bacterium]|nr:MAG: low molecular weight protein arginine phosphatase [candidate division Zixibacteria bacterium]
MEKKGGKFKVLFVCTGNTCRSPMAAGSMNKLLSEADFDGIEVGSAGTGALNGWPAAPHALEVTKNWGIDISAHRSRTLDEGTVEAADLIICMALEHHRAARQLSASSERKSYLLASYPQRPEETPLARIEDPMGGDLEVYEKAFMRIDEHLRRIFGDLLERARAPEEGR